MPPNPKADSDRRYMLLAVKIVAEFGATIAIPVVVFAMIGKHLDAVYGTRPYLLIAGFVLAAALTAVIIRKRARDFGKEYEDIEKKG